MAFFESPEQAWHDAYATIKKSSSDWSNTGGCGTLDGYKTYMAELSKITSAVQKLPDGYRHLGMVLFAPEPSHKNTEYVRQLIWKEYCKFRAERLKSFKQVERMSMLVSLAIKEAQMRIAIKQPIGMTHAQIGRCLNLCDIKQYNREWRPDLDMLVKILMENGYKALDPICEVVKKVNKSYRVECVD